MKNVFILFFFVFLPLSFFSQNKRLSLQIKTDNKPSLHGFSYWQQLKISSKDTSFATSFNRSNPDVFKNLKAGTYSITVSSVFNHQVTKKFVLSKKNQLTKINNLTSFSYCVWLNFGLIVIVLFVSYLSFICIFIN